MTSPIPASFPDGTPYPTIPAGTTTVNVSSASQLTSALSAAVPGHRIVLANGTYSGDFTISGKTGTSTNGISIEAANTGGAVFASGSTFRINNCAYVTAKGLAFTFDTAGDTFQFRGTTHHSRITRCTFGPASHTASSNVSTMIFVGDDSFHIRIDHNEIRNKGTSGNGVRVYGSFDKVDSGQGHIAGCRWVRIDHNIFRSIKPEVGNDKEPVRYGVSTMSRTTANGVIERNFFTDCICEPEIISVKMGAIRTSGNTILRCAGGPVIRHGTDSTMSDNYIVDREDTFGETIGSGGIRFYDAGHDVTHNYIDGVFGGNFQAPLLLDTGDAEGSSTNLSNHWRVVNALVERNVIVDSPEGIGIGDNYNSAPTGCTIRDNVVARVDTGTAVTQRIAPVNTTLTNNTYSATPAGAGLVADSDGIFRKAGFGPRLTYLEQADVGPAGDLADTDGTGALVGGGGPPTGADAGADVPSHQVNTAFTRTAAETGLSGVTSRTWTIVSAPEGGSATDPTSAGSRYGWGDPLPQSDEFNYLGAPTSSKWSLYNGEGHDGNGRRVPGRITVDGSKMIMTGLANGDTGGMAHSLDQQYGRWEVRCRSYNTSSSGATYHPVLIIWPESGEWPEDGEYDFLENSAPGEMDAGSFIHFPHDADVSVQQRFFEKLGVNLQNWHNFAIEWTSEHIRTYIDGEIWFTTADGANSVRRNIQDMPSGHLTIQLDNFNGASGNREGAFEVDWVRIYTLTPQGGGGSSTIGTAAALNWTPTTPGAYVLRYTVVTSGGTFTDDVAVTVGSAPASPGVYPHSIPSEESFGAPIVSVDPPSEAVLVQLGVDTTLGGGFVLGYYNTPPEQDIFPASIPSEESFGAPEVTVDPEPQDQDVFPASIPSEESFGAPAVTVGQAPPGQTIADLSLTLFAIDPDDGHGIPLPDVEALTISPERNSAGSISFGYPERGVNFAHLRDAINDDRDIEVEIWTTGSPAGALRGYVQESSGDPIAEGAGLWQFGGGFLEIRMGEAVVEPQPLGPLVPDDDDDPTNDAHANEKRELVFAAATPGDVMAFCMVQAQARGALTDLVWDFTADYDSDGVAWPDVLSTRFSPLVTYDSILGRLVELGLAEWAVEWTGAHRVLRMWVPEGRGEDRTLENPPIVLRHGENLLDAPHRWTIRDAGTTLYVAGGEGLYDDVSDATALTRRGRRIERAVSANNLNTPTAVEAYAQAQLEITTTSILEVTHGIGFLPGQPRPITEYSVGDWLYSQTGPELDRYRVVQWTVTQDSSGGMRGTVTLNDSVTESIIKLKKRIDAMQGGETVIGTSTGPGGATEDTGIPQAPTGVVVGSVAFLVQPPPDGLEPGITPAAVAHAAVTVGWLAVTLNVDGTAASDLQGYKVQYAYAAQPELWIGVEDVGPNRLSTTFDASPGTELWCRVAAYDRNGNTSEWSESVAHTTEFDTTPPQVPSAPVVTDYLGTIRVRWDGMTADGVDMMAASPDFSHVEVHVSAGSLFTPTTVTQVGQLRGYGTYSIIDMPYDTAQFVRLVAVDALGNRSEPSAQGFATPTKLVNIDIGPNAIDRAQIIDGEIVNAKIADLAVNDAKVMNLGVGKLITGYMQADMIMSTGEIRTGDNPNTYGSFSSAGLQFRFGGVLTIDISGTTGKALLTGGIKTGITGERLDLNADGTFRMYGSSGTDYAQIANDGGIVRFQSRADSSGRRSWVDFDPTGFRAVYGTTAQHRSRFDAGLTYTVMNAPVTGIRVWSQFTPTDGTQNRFHFVVANTSGDVEKSVLHYRLNPFNTNGVMIQHPVGDDGSGVHWDDNAVKMVKGDGNAYVYVDAADLRKLSTELAKQDIAPIRHVGGRSSLDVVVGTRSYGFVYDFAPNTASVVPVERRQPDGSMAIEQVETATGVRPPPRRHFFPIAEHLQKVAPELVHVDNGGGLMVSLGDTVGVLWDAVQELAGQVRQLRGDHEPVIVEGQVLDPSRWRELPRGEQ